MKEMQKILRRDSRGFTLPEVLIAVAILLLLSSVAVLGVGSLSRSIRQTQLDSTAQILYVAAQNRLTELRASGRGDLYQHNEAAGLRRLGYRPADAADSVDENGLLYYSSSGADAYLSQLLPAGYVDDEVRSGSWVVEYAPASGEVYAVFFSESEPLASFYTGSSADDFYRESREARIELGADVGYYGGGGVSVDAAEGTYTLNPQITVLNGEKLQAQLFCQIPEDLASAPNRELTFHVTATDESGDSHIWSNLIPAEAGRYTRTRSYLLTLDALEEGQHFRQLAPGLTPGDDITLELRVTCQNSRVPEARAGAVTNSLFAYGGGADTALLNRGRHLQNLDRDTSGVKESIRYAVQTGDIRFSEDTADDQDWFSIYCQGRLRAFKPIENQRILSLKAQDGSVIYGLTVEAAGDAGLFSSFAGSSMEHVQLSGASVSGSGDVGALAGKAIYDAQFLGCGVFLREADVEALDESHVWISGSTGAAGSTGGLVGRALGDLGISDSFAASVISGGGWVGGLVGCVDGDLILSTAYSDCYLSGRVVGGISASCGEDSVFLSSYSAGFITAEREAAGLTPSAVAELRNVYAAAELRGASCLRTAASAVTAENLYYLEGVAGTGPGTGKNTAELSDLSAMQAALGGASGGFSPESNTNKSFPYNLKADMELRTYPYPRLSSLSHYGDWPASFRSGALVYFERYEDGSWGFAGGNVNTLAASDSGHYAVEGGYALLFDGVPDSDVLVSWQTDEAGNHSSLNLGKSCTALTVAGKEYYLMQLPEEIQSSGFVASGFYREFTVSGSSYWFNPHFANTVVPGETRPELAVAGGNTVVIRTARQLYNLSLYYDSYSEQTKDCCFQQQLVLDYGAYQWPAGVFSGEQKPIGSTESAPFRAVYDGMCHEIRGGVSFRAHDTAYGGLFGWNAGTLRNIVLTDGYRVTDYRSVRCSYPTGFGSTAYVGTLAGGNSGTVENCAAAGYVLEAYAYNGAMIYLGGLVGCNTGTVRNTSASTPRIQLECTYADADVGGLVGLNRGSVSYSYAYGYVHARQFKNCQMSIAGFAGRNNGSITASYCATALMAEGEMSVLGFTSATGSVNRCYYLNGGAYQYAGTIQSYHNDSGRGQPVTGQELEDLSLSGFGAVASAPGQYHVYAGAEADFLYPGSVKGADGRYIHYGEWISPAGLGEVGMVYWEREEGGSNAGYHFSILPGRSLIEGSSTLCQAHDDGGIITEYGYGYYVMQRSLHSGEADWGLRNVSWQDIAEGSRNAAAEQELSRQLDSVDNRYSFYLYTSGTSGMYLDSAAAVGSLHLEYEGSSYRFRVSPFFADAMSLAQQPGSEEKPYQVRSVAQLQFLNWNSSTDNTSTSVNASTYRQFPYLYSADSTSQARQAKKPINAWWVQTHDISGAAVTGYVPIADAATTSSANSYDAVLYAWFGGSYDGQSYKIQNLNINSQNYSVGLFGVTAGAQLRNIILYSDRGNVIQRSGSRTGAYAIGGLVGVAYDYQDPSGNSIENCAIAGYSVQDNSTGLQTLGEANVGGLIGVANVDLHNCSSVVELQINCTHENGHATYGDFIRVGGVAGANKNVMTNCYSGGTVIVGADTLSESRNASGNKVTAAQSRSGTSNRVATAQSTHVFIGGLAGSGFTSNYKNFSGSTGSHDGKPKFTNCYTYMDFPEFGGSIRGICIIGGVADRYAYTTSSTVNCYYLNTVSGLSLPEGYQEYRFVGGSTGDTNVGTNFRNMLRGNMNHFRPWITGGSNYTTYTGIELTELSYARMSDLNTAEGLLYRINGGSAAGPFKPVTTTEQGIRINGKYSFICGDEGLEGRNYPFPTIITQAEKNGEVSVHYGPWPKNSGLFLNARTLRLDLLGTLDGEGEYEAVLKLRAYSDNRSLSLEGSDFSILYDAEILDVSLDPVPRMDGEGAYYLLTVRGLQPGGDTVILRCTGSDGEILQTELDVSVTAVQSLEAVERSGDTLYSGDRKQWELRVLDRNGNLIPTDASNWQVTSENADIAQPAVYSGEGELLLEVLALDPGDTLLSLLCSDIPVKDPTNSLTVTSDTLLLEVNVLEPATLGLANSEREEYQEFFVRDTVSDVQDGCSGIEKPNLPGSVLLLYSNTESAFSQWEVADARVNGISVYPYDSDNRLYSVRMASAPVKSGRYYALPVSVETAMTGADVQLSITLQSRSDSSVHRTLTVDYRLPNSPTEYDVRYWSVPNELFETERVVYGGSALGPVVGAQPVRVGYTFDALWYEDTACSREYDFAAHTPIYDDTDLYAGWDANTYTLYFDLNYAGAGAAPAPVTVTFDAPFGPLPLPQRPGYALTGWYTAPDAGTGERVTEDRIFNTASDLTLYARWQEVHFYPVTFEDRGTVMGSCYACPELAAFYGEADNQNPALDALDGIVPASRTGWRFDGYAVGGLLVADAAGNLLPVAREISAPVTAEAVWTLQRMKLELKISGSAYMAGKIAAGESTVTWDAGYAIPGGNTSAAYSFQGWFTAADADALAVLKPDGSLIPAVSGYTDADGSWLRTEDTVLYARWTRTERAYIPATALENGGVYVIYYDSYALGTTASGSLEIQRVEISPQLLNGYYRAEDGSAAVAYSISQVGAASLWEYGSQGYLHNSVAYLYVNSNDLRVSTSSVDAAKWQSSSNSVYSLAGSGKNRYKHLCYSNSRFTIRQSNSSNYTNSDAVDLYRQTEVYCYVYDYE